MTESLLILFLFLAVLAIGFLLYRNFALGAEIETRARRQYEAWRENDLTAIRQQYETMAQKETEVQVQRWKQESEVGIRKDAIEKRLFRNSCG
jgi:predicted Holliday junction resolvase-like endonuclease